MKNFSIWNRSHLEPPFIPGAGASPIGLDPESESPPGPQTSKAGAAQKSGGSATLGPRAGVGVFSLAPAPAPAKKSGTGKDLKVITTQGCYMS